MAEGMSDTTANLKAEQFGTDIACALKTMDTELEGLLALRKALEGELGRSLSAAVEIIARCGGRLIVSGMGKSGHIGRKLSATLSSTGTAAYFVHPGEASHGDLGMILAQDVVLALSWSGETTELSDIVAYTRRFQVPLVAITSRADSTLAQAADIALVLPRMNEACPNGLAPTTSTTAMLALGDVVAICLLSRRGFSSADFRDFHPGGKLGARLRRVRDLMHGGASEVPTVSMGTQLSNAIVSMTSGRFGITGVVDDAGKLVGVVTDGDVRRAFENGFLDRPVAEVMGRTPRVALPDGLAQEALGRMNAERITSLFVVEDGRPIGILHVHDLLQAGLI